MKTIVEEVRKAKSEPSIVKTENIVEPNIEKKSTQTEVKPSEEYIVGDKIKYETTA